MQVFFESRDPDGAQWRDIAVRRLRFAMRRVAGLVPRARLQLSDVNGPRGGVDKRCQLELQTDGGGTVIVSAMARDWRDAIDATLTRAAHALRRRAERRRSRRAPLLAGVAVRGGDGGLR